MANRGATAVVVVVVAVGVLVAGSPATGAPADVVLHVTNYAAVPAGQFADARRAVVTLYAKTGVHLVWADGVAALALPDGARHLDVVVLNTAMADRLQSNRFTFGQASRAMKRAYIFYERAWDHALSTGTDGRMLALVLAHEIGHMLLPRHSHTALGLMKAEWVGTISAIPAFLPEQAATIRKLRSERR
jgi:hypothetical protein